MISARRLLSPIAIRLALASIIVAVVAIGIVAGVTLYQSRGDVSTLVRQEQERTATTTEKAVAAAYRAAGSWHGADLAVPASLAAHSEARLIVLDHSGRRVPVPRVSGASEPAVLKGPLLSAPVIVQGTHVGRAILHFYQAAIPSAEASLRDALIRTVAGSAALAALFALGVSVVFSRRITRPVTALTRAVRSIASGNHSARVGDSGGGELGELTTAFDRMADTIARDEELRIAIMADVAHELRTPLSILQAGTESLVDRTVPPTPATLASLHDEVLRLGRVVEDLDTLASAEATHLQVALEPIDVSEPVRQALANLKSPFEDAHVTLVTQLSAAPAIGDSNRIQQIVLNLLSNALKFTNAGGVVTVRVRSSPAAAILEVTDTGIGIPESELSHVFDRFWRGREAGRLAGSGIGLAVVRTLVEAQGGTVEVHSPPSRGSRFTVRIPRSPHRRGLGADPVPAAPTTPHLAAAASDEPSGPARRGAPAPARGT